MVSCTLKLDNYREEYHPGDTIKGRVVVWTQEELAIRRITLDLTGKEQTLLVKRLHHYSSRLGLAKYMNYKGCNVFLSLKETIYPKGKPEDGRQIFPFTFTLPNNIPSTYANNQGSIKYLIDATVRSKNFVDYMAVEEFNVKAPVDFNLMKEQLRLEPVFHSIEKEFPDFCCFSSGPISIDVLLPKAAFVEGEQVEVKVEVNNMSSKDVKRIEVQLRRGVTYKATTPQNETKYFENVLLIDKEEGTKARREQTYKFLVEIPQWSLASNFGGCRLFNQKFILDVTAYITNSVFETISIPIVLGHIPLRKEEFTENNTSSTGNEQTCREEDLSENAFPQSEDSLSTNSLPHSGRYTANGEPVLLAEIQYPPNKLLELNPLTRFRGPVPCASSRQRSIGFDAPYHLSCPQDSVMPHPENKLPSTPISNTPTAPPASYDSAFPNVSTVSIKSDSAFEERFTKINTTFPPEPILPISFPSEPTFFNVTVPPFPLTSSTLYLQRNPAVVSSSAISQIPFPSLGLHPADNRPLNKISAF